MNDFGRIGVLGGVGPVASAELHRLLLDYAQDEYGAVEDDEYPHIVVNSVPFSATSNLGVEDEAQTREEYIEGIHALVAHDLDVVLLPCNTLHAYRDLVDYLGFTHDLIDAVEDTAESAGERGVNDVLVLASRSSRDDRLHEPALDAEGVGATYPDDGDQQVIDEVIQDVMGGEHGPAVRERLEEVMGRAEAYGCDGVVLGCTELSLPARHPEAYDRPVVDSLHVLAVRAVEAAYEG